MLTIGWWLFTISFYSFVNKTEEVYCWICLTTLDDPLDDYKYYDDSHNVRKLTRC